MGLVCNPNFTKNKWWLPLGWGAPKKSTPGGGYESTNRHLWGSNHLASSPARLTSSSREIGRLQQNLPVKINNHPRCRNLSINSMLHYFLLKTHIWLISTTVYYVSISFLERTLCAHMSKSQKKMGSIFPRDSYVPQWSACPWARLVIHWASHTPCNLNTLQGTNISHLGKLGKSSSKCRFLGDMLVSWRVNLN